MITTLILVATYVLVAYAVQSFAGFGEEGIGLNNPDNADDVLTDPRRAGRRARSPASLLLLTVSVSALSSTQTTILPTARGTLSMAVYEAHSQALRRGAPALHDAGVRHHRDGRRGAGLLSGADVRQPRTRWPTRSPRWAWRWRSTTASPPTPACGTSARTLFESARNLFMRGIFPLLGALAMTWAFVQSAIDMIQPDYGYTAFGSIGGVFVLGVGMLVLGIPLMLLCFAFGTKRFFRGRTLNADTEVKVPDVY